MKKLLVVIALLLIVHGYAQTISKIFSTNNKSVLVYTTAQNTDYKISLTDSLHFTHMGQPVETQVCVFVDPTQKFQKLIGIGGALTDASAETYYKKPIMILLMASVIHLQEQTSTVAISAVILIRMLQITMHH